MQAKLDPFYSFDCVRCVRTFYNASQAFPWKNIKYRLLPNSPFNKKRVVEVSLFSSK